MASTDPDVLQFIVDPDYADEHIQLGQPDDLSELASLPEIGHSRRTYRDEDGSSRGSLSSSLSDDPTLDIRCSDPSTHADDGDPILDLPPVNPARLNDEWRNFSGTPCWLPTRIT
jgi:hypothetical protein